MKIRQLKLLFTTATFAAVLLLSIQIAQSAEFNIVYDDTFGGGIESTIIGNGTLSYDGPAGLGSFPLSRLPNLQFSAVVGQATFTTADINTDLSASNLLVFDYFGQTLATFTGGGGIQANGSFDLVNPSGQVLSHEPGPAGAPCCGGEDNARLYFSSDGPDVPVSGNYRIALVPEPSAVSLTMLVLGCSMLGRRRLGTERV